MKIITFTAPIELQAARDDDRKGPRTCTMTAYTGGPMRIAGWDAPVVVDISGMRGRGKSRPLLRDHNARAVVGHGVANGDTTLTVEGVMSGAGPDAAEVIAASDNGFPWQCSIGASVEKDVFIPAGKTGRANGQEFEGPVYIARKTTLSEISFVALGADDNTSASIAASAARSTEETITMDFEKWLEALGFQVADLTADQQAKLQAKYDAEQKAATPPAPPPAEPPKIEASVVPQVQSDIAAARKAAADEVKRIQAIRALDGIGDHPDIEAKAIEDGWEPIKAELALLRAARPKPPAVWGGRKAPTARILECAIRMGSGDDERMLLSRYGEEVMEAAHPHRGLGLKGVIHAACALDGRPVPTPFSSERDLIATGFSTATLPTLLGNTANKVMMDAYSALPSVAKRVARKLSANDFKTHTGAMLTGDFTMEKIGASGQLEHAQVDDDSFTYSVNTYGRIFGITRQMLKNDDLGAFMDVPRMLGRGAALAIEKAFWTLVLANTGSYFASGNSNLITTALGSAGLEDAVEKFLKQTDPDGEPISLMPKYLVVPPELKVTADELYVSTNINTGGSSSTDKVPNRNVFAGKYEPLATPYLSNTGITGYSTTGWYLFGDPADIPAFGIAYLDGQENPTVEDAPLSSDILGQAWRGYIDFGVCQINHRGAVKSTGAG